jgi:choline dehydrogenase-like flavoprotein
MRKAVVVGSGAGGAAAAHTLSGSFEVTVLEAGAGFRPFGLNLSVAEHLKKAGLLFDEREIQLIFPAMKVKKTSDMVLVKGIGEGGTTPLSAGNALRVDGDLKELGIDLDDEFDEIYREIPISRDHGNLWREPTRRLFEICEKMDLDPRPIPKLGNYRLCRNCGRCVLGCAYGAKWDSREYLRSAIEKGAGLIKNCRATKVVEKNGRVRGVLARKGLSEKLFEADVVVLAAGGLGTPVILEASGIECDDRLFVDPVLTVAAEWKDCRQNRELSMPFAVQREHFILSPYFDHLSFFFNRRWKHPAKDILGIMIKLADESSGSVRKNKIRKTLTGTDKERLSEGVALCTEIFGRLGIEQNRVFLGSVNAGHPGGALPLTAKEKDTFHNDRLPEGLYIADATLFPKSLGNPPILTIIAMAKRVCGIIKQRA